jgi:UDP-glucuronate 4-epimerase
VSDICAGLLSALHADGVIGETINLGHNEPVEMRHIIALLERALGRKAVIEQRPAREEDLPVTCADLTKAKRLLGYAPRVPLEEGVAEYIDWYRKVLCAV